MGFEHAYPPPTLPVWFDSLYPLSIHVKMWISKSFSHICSFLFTSVYWKLAFLLIHSTQHWRFSFNPSLKYHASTRSSPPWNQRRLSACSIDKFKTLLSACWLLTSATLCVELKRAVSPARTQCWWVQFRSSGKYKGGGGKSIRTTVTTPSTISDRAAKKSEQENRSRKKNASIGNNGLIKRCEAQKCNRIANNS